MPDEKQGGSFWSTLPGVLSGTAALITAAVGAYVLVRDKIGPTKTMAQPPASAAVTAPAPAEITQPTTRPVAVTPGTAEITLAGALLGPAVAPPFDVPGGGRQQNFANGSAYWHPATGAFGLFGAINQKYQAIGGPSFGYPIMAEAVTPDGVGRFVHFRYTYPNGFVEDRSIYWRADLGAQSTQGMVRLKWAEQGWERGPLGYPTSDEYTASDGKRRQDFEHGYISWTPTEGSIVHNQ